MTDSFIAEKIAPMLKYIDDEGYHDTMRSIAEKLGGEFCYGASRVCVVLPYDDEVIKLTNSDDCAINYCEIEYNNYLSALDYGCAEVLLPVRKVQLFPCGAVYIQKKFSFDYYSSKHRWLKKKLDSKLFHAIDHSSTFLHLFKQFNDPPVRDWFLFVYATYGKEFCKRFINWANDNKVNDLHDCNVGFLHNKPIILDYAGYNGSGKYSSYSCSSSSESSSL